MMLYCGHCLLENWRDGVKNVVVLSLCIHRSQNFKIVFKGRNTD